PLPDEVVQALDEAWSMTRTIAKTTKLILRCHHLLFEQILELLSHTIDVQTLEFDSLLLNRTNSLSFQQNQQFPFISNRNKIENVTIIKGITLDKIQLCILLFSQMKPLTINLHKIQLESILQFILLESNLSLLCLSKQRKDFFESVKTLIDSKELIRNYTIKHVNRKVYLWW
ncbi:unnamed protein product, partial [Adineta steineri]